MSTDGSHTVLWGDGEHIFRLRLGELRELEAKRESGSLEIWMRLGRGTWRVDDVTETLRLGLIGGGVPTHLALGLVAKYVKPTTFLANVTTARDVLGAALFGDPEDLVGKSEAETATPEPTPSTNGAGSDSRPSSETAPQWDGHRARSMSAASGNSLPPSKDGNGPMVPTRQDPEA